VDPVALAPDVDPAVASIRMALLPARLTIGPIEDRSNVLGSIRIDPLITAGWKVLLGIAFFTVLVVSAAGFLVHARVTFSARRQEFALLRTIGLSMRQLMSLVVLEQILVIGVAIGIGIFMGTRLGDTIMPYLANSGEQVSVVPPMRLAIDWAGFAATIGLLTLVFLAVIVVILLAVYKMSIHRVMRMGEG
jgi:putative ABC transport system permease protein